MITCFATAPRGSHRSDATVSATASGARWCISSRAVWVSAAISNRLQLQHMRQLRENPDELSFQPIEGNCGSLFEPGDDPQGEPLGFREACNKLIHADDIELPDIRGPVLRLRGQRWAAEIDTLEYVRLSVRNFSDALA
jgi:hypothetical protein